MGFYCNIKMLIKNNVCLCSSFPSSQEQSLLCVISCAISISLFCNSFLRISLVGVIDSIGRITCPDSSSTCPNTKYILSVLINAWWWGIWQLQKRKHSQTRWERPEMLIQPCKKSIPQPLFSFPFLFLNFRYIKLYYAPTRNNFLDNVPYFKTVFLGSNPFSGRGFEIEYRNIWNSLIVWIQNCWGVWEPPQDQRGSRSPPASVYR